jgi:NTP pyrophosphatase (non-canonical NTP hydrolase)
MTTFNVYQALTHLTVVYDKTYNVIYPTLGLVGEAGEIANKVKKIYRDKRGEFSDADREEIGKEIGDVLWYCSALCTDLGLNLETQVENNLRKLRSRLERGTLQGSGDNR